MIWQFQSENQTDSDQIKQDAQNELYHSQNQNFILQSTFRLPTIEFFSEVFSPSHFVQRKRFRWFFFFIYRRVASTTLTRLTN